MRLQHLCRPIVAIFITALLGACAGSGGAPGFGVPGGANQPVAAPVQEVFVAEDYLLGSGDRVKVTVFGEDDLSGEYEVDGSGQVPLPLIGQVRAMGLTVQGFQQAVEVAFRDGYLKDPRVSAEVTTYRPYYILGEVNQPGTYAYQNGLTVLNAVATAQGFTYRANEKNVFIRRDGAQDEQRVPLTSTTQVRPGDTIRISERFF